MADRPFTTADADRLLGLGDLLLKDWKEAADTQHFGEVGPAFVERRAEWQAIRPMLVQAPVMRSLLDEANAAWGAAFSGDEDVNGGDLVEWFSPWLQRVQKTLGTLLQAEASAPVRLDGPGGPT